MEGSDFQAHEDFLRRILNEAILRNISSLDKFVWQMVRDDLSEEEKLTLIQAIEDIHDMGFSIMFTPHIKVEIVTSAPEILH